MAGEITDMVLKQICETCKSHKNKNQNEPLLPHPVLELPWQKVGVDLCEEKGTNYLVMVDYFVRLL